MEMLKSANERGTSQGFRIWFALFMSIHTALLLTYYKSGYLFVLLPLLLIIYKETAEQDLLDNRKCYTADLSN